jgi:hypothetical protein
MHFAGQLLIVFDSLAFLCKSIRMITEGLRVLHNVSNRSYRVDAIRCAAAECPPAGTGLGS